MLDLLDLVGGRDASHGESVAHAGSFADRVGNAIEEAELRGQVLHLVTKLDHEYGLIDIRDDLAIDSLEVACQGDGLVIPHELMGHGCHLEVDVVHSVGTLVAPVSDDGLAAELESDGLLPLVVALVVLTHLHDALQARLRRHELENVVHCQSDSKLRLKGRCLETRPHSQPDPIQVNRIVHIEEARRPSKLLQIGLAESLLQDDVDEVLADIVILVVEGVSQLDLSTSLNIDLDLGFLTTESCLEDQSLLKLSQRIDRLATRDIVTKSCL